VKTRQFEERADDGRATTENAGSLHGGAWAVDPDHGGVAGADLDRGDAVGGGTEVEGVAVDQEAAAGATGGLGGGMAWVAMRTAKRSARRVFMSPLRVGGMRYGAR
jgi:hypothetical protein